MRMCRASEAEETLRLRISVEPEHSDAWRRLDVAILQRYLLDEILQPKFAGGKELTKGYTADPFEIDSVRLDDATNLLADIAIIALDPRVRSSTRD